MNAPVDLKLRTEKQSKLCINQYCEWGIAAFIFLSILNLILESDPNLSMQYAGYFSGIEVFCVVIFSIECIVRTVKHRQGYLFTWLAAIDLIAILPFYLSLFISADLGFLLIFRIFRIFKLTRYFPIMGDLLFVLKKEWKPLGAALFFVLIVTLFSSIIIYWFEHEIQPDTFGSIPQAMWWSIVTLTTVGYGDITPITMGRKIFGACVAITSIGAVALPAGILASGFSDHIRAKHNIQTQDHFADDQRVPLNINHNTHQATRYCSHCHKSYSV